MHGSCSQCLSCMLDSRAFRLLFGRHAALAQVRRAAFADGVRAFTPALIATAA